MGVDIYCKKTGKGVTLGAGGFMRWRMKIAELYNDSWYNHYKKLSSAIGESPEWYKEFDRETERLMVQNGLDAQIIDFCLQSDCDGSITYGTCKKILKVINDYTDNIAYRYATYANHDFDDLKKLLQECVETKSRLFWY